MSNLKQIRQRLGISQIELAKRVGVSLMSIQLWEREVSTPSEKNQEMLDDVLRELESERVESNDEENNPQG